MATELDLLEAEFHRVAALSGEERAAALLEVERRCGPTVGAALRELLAAADLTETPLDIPAVGTSDSVTLVDDLRAFVLGGARRPESASGQAPTLPELPGYRLLGRLGRGGSGTVYLAEQVRPEFTRTVALKIVDRVADPESSRRFEDERRILARLEHPGIARLYDAGLTAAGQPFLAMERVDGLPISEHCELHRLPLDARLRLFLAVLEAVDCAHQAGVVHRDLKPGNILVSARGEAKLLDFGIARIVAAPGEVEETRTAERAMTPAYASPEQVLGQRVTSASDIYSLGVVLYELLAGILPYRVDGVRFETYEDAVRGQEPEPPSTAITRATDTTELAGGKPELARRRRALRGDLDAVVLRALRKEPEARYATVRELALDLECVLAGRPVAARSGERRYRWWRRLRRQRRRLAIAATVGGGIALLALPITRERLLLPLLLPAVADGLALFESPLGANEAGAAELAAGAAALRRSDGLAARE
ncbi:MAG: serine/threonine-protein kinase, partial [Thermoanaerobaculia bacterium]